MDRNAQPLVSVCTPVYNGAAFLRECIESVLAQTYQNWRYVILDNASTDATREIAMEYALRDPRVVVEHNDSLLPIIQNHNRAIAFAAQGSKYCKPLCADDWLYPECLERMVAAAEADPAIGLVCSLAFDGRHACWDGMPYPAVSVDGKVVGQLVLRDSIYVFGTPTSTFFRSDLVRRRDRFYSEQHLHADYEVCLEVLLENRFAFVHQVLSLNRIHDGRQTTAAGDLDSLAAGNLYVFLKYAPRYLTAAEQSKRLKVLVDDYYCALAKAVIRRKGRRYWDYHARYMALAGTSVSRPKIVAAMASLILRKLSRPIRSLRSALAVN